MDYQLEFIPDLYFKFGIKPLATDQQWNQACLHIQGPLYKWTEHSLKFHFLKLQGRGGLSVPSISLEVLDVSYQTYEGSQQKLGKSLENIVLQNLVELQSVNNRKCSHKSLF